MPFVLFDFHTHTFFSDGELSPIELLRRCHVAGYTAVAVTDHASPANVDTLVPALARDCRIAEEAWGIVSIPGVEITHVPPEEIDAVARRAAEAGAELVAVHGETIAEPVAAGTNRAALESDYVHALVHPGLLSPELAQLAQRNGKWLELSARPRALAHERARGGAGSVVGSAAAGQ